jgi:hypothetical protein
MSEKAGQGMAESDAEPTYRPLGLYYPYFQVRDDRWMKVAALYWPKIVRIVPDGYRTRDSATARALSDELIVRRPPGRSVDAASGRFVELADRHGMELRNRFGFGGYAMFKREKIAAEVAIRGLGRWRPLMTGIHVSFITDAAQDALINAGLAWPGRRAVEMLRAVSDLEGTQWEYHNYDLSMIRNAVDGTVIHNPRRLVGPETADPDEWIIMRACSDGTSAPSKLSSSFVIEDDESDTAERSPADRCRRIKTGSASQTSTSTTGTRSPTDAKRHGGSSLHD